MVLRLTVLFILSLFHLRNIEFSVRSKCISHCGISSTNYFTMDTTSTLDWADIEKLLESSIDKILAKVVGTLSERQAAIERNTEYRLQSLGSLLNSLKLKIQDHQLPSPGRTHHSPSSSYNNEIRSQASKFVCNLCKHVFATLSAIDTHIKASHPSLHRQICDKVTQSKPDLSYHYHKVHGLSTSTPNVCSNSPSDDPATGLTRVKCDKCSSIFNNLTDLRDHKTTKHSHSPIQSKSNNSTTTCDECDGIFMNTNELINHLNVEA